jgi:hypothetical protein
MSLTRHLGSLSARFDRLALRPPAARPDEAALAARWPDVAAQLLAWCHQGAGPGNAAPWAPGARPRVLQRLALATLHGPDATITIAWADAQARRLDASTTLEALPGRAAGIALRLRVKANDAMWWRTRQPGDPWDAGWAVDTPPALRHLKAGFAPRRATLMLADSEAAAALRPVLAALWQRQDGLHHPVRWLWVGGPGELPAQLGLAMARFDLG